MNTYYALYSELGYGFLESVYQKAFALMLTERGLRFQEQTPIRVLFHGINFGEFFGDLLVESTVLVELKAVRVLEQAHERQLLNFFAPLTSKSDCCLTLDRVHNSGDSPSTTIAKAEAR